MDLAREFIIKMFTASILLLISWPMATGDFPPSLLWKSSAHPFPLSEGILSESSSIENEAISPIVIDQPVEETPVDEIPADESSAMSNIQPVIENPSDQLIQCLFSLTNVPSPKAAAFRPDGQEIWVTSLMNSYRGLIVFDAITGAHLKNIVLPDGGAVELIFNQDGSRVYASQMETARVFELDAQTKEILRILPTGSTWTKELALSADQNWLYASNWVGNDVSIINLQTGQLQRRQPTVKTPRGIYLFNNFLYVAGFDNGEIEKINLINGQGEVIYQTGGAMRHIVGDPEKGVLYVSDMGRARIYKVDLDTDQVIEFAQTDINPNTIALSPDGRVLAVSNRGRNHPSGNYYIPGLEWGSILFFDTTDGQLLEALIGGNQPTALAISPDGQRLVYSNFLDHNLTVCQLPCYEDLKAAGGQSDQYRESLAK